MEQFVVGVDIGGTNTEYGLVDHCGKVWGAGSLRTATYSDFGDFVRDLVAGVRGLMEALEAKMGSGVMIVGVGVGAPNGNHERGVIVDAPNLPWRGVVDIVGELSGYFNDIPVMLTNDAKAAALGEGTYGAARGMRDFLVITVGTGLGSGFVVNGELMYGYGGMAGELGHVTVGHITPAAPVFEVSGGGLGGGRVCGCGRLDCLETYVSAGGVVRSFLELSGGDADHSATTQVTAQGVAQAAMAGDVVAIRTFELTGKILGRALAVAVAITSPEAVVVAGGVARAGELLLRPAKQEMEQSLMSQYRGTVRVVGSGLVGRNAGLLGAAAMVWRRV